MPELPEVETVRRGLAPVLEGRRFRRVVCYRPDLRQPFPENMADRLTGQLVVAVRRRAKFLLVHLESGLCLMIHLGMSGRIAVFDGPPPPLLPHDHVEFETDDGLTARFHDPRRFGLMALSDSPDTDPLLAGLGPEPLEEDFDGPALTARLAGRRGPIKTAIMDQAVVAGMGNIYASESLFRAGISPLRKASAVRGNLAARLAGAIREVLSEAVAAGGSTLRDHRLPSGEEGRFQHSFAVYGREGKACPGCSCDLAKTGGVRKIAQSGRATFYCAARQR